MKDFEKLGVFYLGREYDLASGKRLDAPVLYDSRDLVTHAVCAGMTGSGKTGLCLSILEEAAIDGVPVIAIDPKGDVGNLLLTFPRLKPEDFRPWIDDDEARRAGMTADAFAEKEARTWAEGLEDWGQDSDRIERLRGAADFAIYTPGSRAGLAVSLLSSFAAPPPAIREDGEMLGERAASTATSLLVLAGVEAAPRSREHTLVTTLLTSAWKEGRDLDLTALIHDVQSPPFRQVGVIDVETFFPERDRFALAMAFNAVLAAPGFAQWFDGEPLDPSRLLYTREGHPRVSIFSIAHLGDAERMFFVSLLLNEMVGWMRAQTGTASLRAILYMDEIAGYFPPVADPPSKGPLLTLLKQGRAFGLGVLLATQNPVDLDYKGLSNIGTWFLGRLQTERDKARVLDGLQGTAAGALDRADADRMLSSLGKRVFLLHDVHAPHPLVFQTRWTLSYLRGPLSRDQIRTLMSGRAPGSASPAPAPGDQRPSEAPRAAKLPSTAGAAPVLPPGIDQFYVPRGAGAAAGLLTYAPVALGAAKVAFSDPKAGVEVTRDVLYAAPITEEAVAVDWSRAVRVESPASALRRQPEGGDSRFAPLPAAGTQPKSYAAWQKAFASWLAQNERVELLRDAESGLVSKPDETERDFRIRVQDQRRAGRDEAVDRLRQKYAPKQAALAERLRRAEDAVAREQQQATAQKLQTAVSMGATLLGALLGRRAVTTSTLGRATTAARGVGRSMKEASDVNRATESVEAVRAQIKELDDQVRAETDALAQTSADPQFERVALTPKRGQIGVAFVALGWIPA